MADWRLTFDAAALKRLFESDEGPVAKDIAKRTIQVERTAKRLAPVRTGRLRASITSRMARDGRGIFGIVGTNVVYAPYVELGTIRMAGRPFLRPALRSAARKGEVFD